MERLTDEIAVIEPGTYLVLDDLLDNMPEIQSVSRKELYYRLGLIENALGKNYDLDHLRELVKADREGRVHIGRCLECNHYEGLAECEYLGNCGGTDWICGWFEPKKSSLKERKVNPKSIEVNAEVN